MNSKPFITLLWSITLTIAGVFVLVGISLIPHFHEIGVGATIMVFIFMFYGTVAAGGFLAFKLYRWYVYRNVISIGEVVAYKNGDDFAHLSAEHERAKVALPAITVKEVKEEPHSEEGTVVELHNQGLG